MADSHHQHNGQNGQQFPNDTWKVQRTASVSSGEDIGDDVDDHHDSPEHQNLRKGRGGARSGEAFLRHSSSSVWAPTSISRDEDSYQEDLEASRRTRLERQKKLEELDVFWTKKATFLQSTIHDHTAKVKEKEQALEELLHPPERTYPGPAWLVWVESQWFNMLASLVVMASLATMTQETLHHVSYFWLDQGLLAYFVLELALRAGLYRGDLLCGLSLQVASNWLDTVVVVGGVLDLWVVPLLGNTEGARSPVLSSLRILRLARMLKLVNVFMRADLAWTESDRFQMFIMFVIGFSSLVMSFQTDFPDLAIWSYWEEAILIIFVFELSARMKQSGLVHFLCSPEDRLWNYFDSFIVGLGVTDLWLMPTVKMVKIMLGMSVKDRESAIAQFLGLLRILRLFRILRLLRLIKSIPPLFNLLRGIAQAMAGMMWVAVLAIVVLYAFGLLTVALLRDGLIEVKCGGDIEDACPWEKTASGEFGESNHPRCTFSSVTQTMLILFELMNGHMGAFEDMLTCVPFIKPALIIYIGLACLTILPILTAVISENMLNSSEDTKGRHNAEMEAALKQRKRAVLNELFDSIDADGSGDVSIDEFNTMLREPFLKDILTATANLRVSELKSIFDLMARHGHANRAAFLKALESSAQEVHQRSIMRFEKRLAVIDTSIVRLAKVVSSSRAEVRWLADQVYDQDGQDQSQDAASPVPPLSLGPLSPL